MKLDPIIKSNWLKPEKLLLYLLALLLLGLIRISATHALWMGDGKILASTSSSEDEKSELPAIIKVEQPGYLIQKPDLTYEVLSSTLPNGNQLRFQKDACKLYAVPGKKQCISSDGKTWNITVNSAPDRLHSRSLLQD